MVRNLKEYPITKEDKIKALDWAIEAYKNSGMIGGVHASALREIKYDLDSLDQYEAENYDRQISGD